MDGESIEGDDLPDLDDFDDLDEAKLTMDEADSELEDLDFELESETDAELDLEDAMGLICQIWDLKKKTLQHWKIHLPNKTSIGSGRIR